MSKEVNVHSHEVTDETRPYFYRARGVNHEGLKRKSLCGRWSSVSSGDPARVIGTWSYEHGSGMPSCPNCVSKAPFRWPGMLLIITGALGIPQVVEVTSGERWVGVFGFSKGKDVSPQGKTIHKVLQDGDELHDVGMKVEGGKLVKME